MPNNPLLQLMHDTKNPIARIKGAIELLQTPDFEYVNRHLLLESIEKSTNELTKVLDDYYTNNKTTEI